MLFTTCIDGAGTRASADELSQEVHGRSVENTSGLSRRLQELIVWALMTKFVFAAVSIVFRNMVEPLRMRKATKGKYKDQPSELHLLKAIQEHGVFIVEARAIEVHRSWYLKKGEDE